MAQQQRSTADQLERVTPDFDRLVHDVRLGARNQAHWHELEERGQRIAAAIVAAFRGAAAQRSQTPPLFIEKRADGSATAGW
jgi:hypothetical protein